MTDPSCYVCGHAPEEHHNGDSECEFEDGCDCICFEAREDDCEKCGGVGLITNEADGAPRIESECPLCEETGVQP